MKFSPIQERILKLLIDGMPHPRKEVWECIGDPLARRAALSPHIMFIRSKLRMIGQDIVTEVSGRAIYYRHVRFLAGNSPVESEASRSANLRQLE